MGPLLLGYVLSQGPDHIIFAQLRRRNVNPHFVPSRSALNRSRRHAAAGGSFYYK